MKILTAKYEIDNSVCDDPDAWVVELGDALIQGDLVAASPCRGKPAVMLRVVCLVFAASTETKVNASIYTKLRQHQDRDKINEI